MEAKVKPTQDIEILRENLEARELETTVKEDDKIIVEASEDKLVDVIDTTPGVENYVIDGRDFEGLKGRPVQEKMYARLRTDEDVAKAFLATVEGYDLVVLDGGLDWHLRLLKNYNPDIRQLSSGRDDLFEVEKSLLDEGPEEKIEYKLSEEEIEKIIRFIQPKSESQED